MRNAIAIGGVILAAVAASTIAATAAQASSNHPSNGSAASNHATGRFVVIERAVTDTVADTGPTGDSLGDVLAFANPIYTSDNKTQIGSDNGSCIRTTVGKAWECSWTLTLAKGSLVVQGPFYDAADSVLAITGGTGIWSHARGEMGLHARDALGSSYDFSYTVTK
jgi:allene oxide cyclase